MIMYQIWQRMGDSRRLAPPPQGQWVIWMLVALGLFLGVGWYITRVLRMRGERRQASKGTVRQQLQETYRELNRLYQEQRTAAVTDVLTELPTAATVMDELQASITTLTGMGDTCGVILIDIDHLKGINDTWGRTAGDAVLHEVAQRLRARMRAGDLIGRYGDEEFVIILRGVVDGLEAYQIAEGLRRNIATAPCRWNADVNSEPEMIPVTASFGVAVAPQHGGARETIMQAASEALAIAKHGGRNRVWLAEWLQDTPALLPPQPDPLTHAA